MINETESRKMNEEYVLTKEWNRHMDGLTDFQYRIVNLIKDEGPSCTDILRDNIPDKNGYQIYSEIKKLEQKGTIRQVISWDDDWESYYPDLKKVYRKE
jgi:hypothetical protein